MSKKFVTIKEAAEMLGVSPLTLRNWDKSGKLPATRHPMNNYRVYKLEDLNKIIESLESTQVAHRPTFSKKTSEKAVTRKLKIKHLDD